MEMGALEELLSKWRVNPDAGATLALCTYLGNSKREELVREVGTTAEAWHRDDAQVMLAIGRMYLDALLLAEAQAALVAAGKANPSNAAPYRYLGEVLLRRGDATRAEKVVARAIQLGSTDDETRMWHDRATVYVALQKRVGMQAVADEIARTIPKQNSIPPPTLDPTKDNRAERFDEPPANGKPTVPPPRLFALSQPKSESIRESVSEVSGMTDEVTVPNMRQRPGSAAPAVLPSFDAPAYAKNSPRSISSRPSSRPVAARAPSGAPAAAAYARSPSPATGIRPHVSPPPPAPLRAAPSPLPPPATPPARTLPPPFPPGSASSMPPALPSYARAPSVPARAPSVPVRAPSVPARAPSVPARPRVPTDDSPSPAPETILHHLAQVGVFEPHGGAAPAWEAAAREKSRGIWVLVVGIVLAIGSGYGGYRYIRQVKDGQMAQARQLEAEVEKLLTSGRIDALAQTDEKLSRIFDLDSRSRTAALLWLRNRVLTALLLPGEPRGIESALHRCKTVGCEPAKTAFGKVASFLSEGDLAGAAALLPKWDEQSKSDAYYQFTAAAMLERAGDVRAVGRYQKAFELDEKLLIARVLHASLVALELGREEAAPFVEQATKRLGDRPAAHALKGLDWALDPERSETPPASAVVEPGKLDELPVPLRSIPFVVAAVAVDSQDSKRFHDKLNEALRVSATPAMATWIGFLAIQRGDAELARAATLRALAHSAIYPRARALAARVALLGAHLDEARNAIQELDPGMREVAVVRAAAAYETLDIGELESAIEALGDNAEESAPSKALARGLGVVLGKRFPDREARESMLQPGIPWGDVVAMDAALDQGDLELAKRIAQGWEQQADQPVYALRLSRLARAEERPADAVASAQRSLVAGGVTPRSLIEATFAFVDNGDARGARELVAKYPAVLGPMTDWLKALVDVAEGQAGRAKALVARLDPPPVDSPLLYQVMMVRALAAIGDTRSRGTIGSWYRRAPKHPDLVAAARAADIIR